MGMLNQRVVDFAVVLLLASFVCWYTWDAYQASSQTENLILIVPIALIALVLCVLEFIHQVSIKTETRSESQEPVKEVLPVIALFTIYVMSLEVVGFDVATILFVGAFLWIQKERRLVWLVGYSLAFGLLMSTFFAEMLPYPMPMTFLPTDY